MPFRAKAAYDASPGAAYTVGGYPVVTIVGLLGAAFGVVFLYLFLTNEQLGLTSQLAYAVVGGILLFSAAWYLVAKQFRRSTGINVDYAFKEIPPE